MNSYITAKRKQGRIQDTPFLEDHTSGSWDIPKGLTLKDYLNFFWCRLPLGHKLKGFHTDEVKDVMYIPSGCLMEYTLYGTTVWSVIPDEMLDEWLELGSCTSEMAFDLKKLDYFTNEQECRRSFLASLVAETLDKL